MINKKNIYKFIVSFESIVISSMIPINIPIPSVEKIYRIVEIPINYQIPIIIFLTLIYSGEFLTKVYAIYILIGLFFLPVFFDGGSLGYILTPNFGFLLGIYPMIVYINKLKFKNKITIYNFILYGIISLLILHLIGIIYLIIQLLIFDRIELILYSIGVYSFAKLPYQILMLFPCTLLLISFKKIKI